MLLLLKVTLDNTKNITYIIIYKIQERNGEKEVDENEIYWNYNIPKFLTNDTCMFHQVLDTG